MMPPPATISGRSASFSMASAFSACLRVIDGLNGRQRLVGVDVELDLGELDVDRQVDQHRAGTARAHQVERLLQRHRHLIGLHDGDRPFGDGRGDRRDVDGLEILLGEPRARRLAGDAQDRDGIGRGRIEAGDHVGAGRARRADAQADIACLGAGVAFGHVRGGLDVARQDMADRAARLQRRIERIDRRARHAESAGNPFPFENENRGVDGAHPGHVSLHFDCDGR